MTTRPALSSSALKLAGLLIVLAAFAARHAFADFETLYVAGFAVVALWVIQAQEQAPGGGWGWTRNLFSGAVLPVHGLLLVGLLAGPALFAKRQGPHLVSTPVTTAAGGCGSAGCGGGAAGCGATAGGGGCGASGGGCSAGGGCGAGAATTMAKKPAAPGGPRVVVPPAAVTSQVKPGFFQLPPGGALPARPAVVMPVPAAVQGGAAAMPVPVQGGAAGAGSGAPGPPAAAPAGGGALVVPAAPAPVASPKAAGS